MRFVIVVFPDHTHYISDAARSKVVVLLLLILFFVFCVWSLFCYAVRNVLFSLEIISMRKRELV